MKMSRKHQPILTVRNLFSKCGLLFQTSVITLESICNRHHSPSFIHRHISSLAPTPIKYISPFPCFAQQRCSHFSCQDARDILAKMEKGRFAEKTGTPFNPKRALLLNKFTRMDNEKMQANRTHHKVVEHVRNFTTKKILRESRNLFIND